MTKIIFFIFSLFVIYSCTKPDEEIKTIPRPLYEGEVSPFLVVTRNDNSSGNIYDTTTYENWIDYYEDEGLLIDLSAGIIPIIDTKWVITSFMNTNYNIEHPYDTIYFLANNKYELHRGPIYGNVIIDNDLKYFIMQNVNGISYTMQLQGIPTFGGTGWFSGQLPWHSFESNQFEIQIFTDVNNPSFKIKNVKFKKVI